MKINKVKLFLFTEFSLVWIGFCFSVVSNSSYQWLVGGPCCRTGLFMQCGVSGEVCTCNQLRETFSWLQATAACGVLATMLSGGAVVVFLFADIKFRRKISTKIRWKYGMILLAMLADVFVITSAALFTSNNGALVTSLRTTFPDSCSFQLQYGYGYIMAWISFIFLTGGCMMSFFNAHKNKI